MTLRMPPWEADRVANVLELARWWTAIDPKMKPWMHECAARIKAAVKAERDKRRRTKRCCRTCKWLTGEKTLEPNCIKNEMVVHPDATCCGQWRMK